MIIILQARKGLPEVDGDFCDIDLTGMRRTIAKRITHSKVRFRDRLFFSNRPSLITFVSRK